MQTTVCPPAYTATRNDQRSGMYKTYRTQPGAFRHRPAFNVQKGETGYNIEIALPGFVREELDIQFKDLALTISGKKTAHPAETRYLRKEFVPADFELHFSLPENTDDAQISSRLEQGVLLVTLPTKAAVAPQKIDIA